MRFQVPKFKLPQDGIATDTHVQVHQVPEVRVQPSTQTHIHEYKSSVLLYGSLQQLRTLHKKTLSSNIETCSNE